MNVPVLHCNAIDLYYEAPGDPNAPLLILAPSVTTRSPSTTAHSD